MFYRCTGRTLFEVSFVGFFLFRSLSLVSFLGLFAGFVFQWLAHVFFISLFGRCCVSIHFFPLGSVNVLIDFKMCTARTLYRCCSVLQCVAVLNGLLSQVCSSALQCVAACCSVLQCTAQWSHFPVTRMPFILPFTFKMHGLYMSLFHKFWQH